MSAIFGILRFDGHPVAARDLERMGTALAHRGPDGRKQAVLGPAGLGHCLMRVNAEDLFESQPLHDSEAKLCVVADLRLDNREELAAALGIGPEELRDMPDSAVLLRAYKMWGAACAERLLGDFAFAIWDDRCGKLVLGRDHMGQRVLLYHLGPGFIAFASEIKALWTQTDVPRALVDDEIGRRMVRMFDGRTGTTLFAGIRGLRGGTVLTIDGRGQVDERRYWEPRADPAHRRRDEAYYVATYRKVLEEAVACRLRRLTRPPALMLSGGFDSSAIAGLARPIVTAQRRKLFTVTQTVSETFRDTVWDTRRWVEACRRVMPHLDVRYFVPQPRSPLADLESRFLICDGPAGSDHHAVYGLVAEAGRTGARLLMDGIGGDYTINPRGHAALAYFLAAGKLRRFLAELGPHRRLTGDSWLRTIAKGVVMPLLPRWPMAAINRWSRGRSQLANASALDSGFAAELVASGTVGRSRRLHLVPVTRMRERIAITARNVASLAVPGSGVIAAAHGMELTRPFHDKRVVELGLALPQDLYVKSGRNRYLACQALADIYPPELLTRSRINDGFTPELLATLDLARSDLLAEAQRLSRNRRLARFVGFAAIRRSLSARPRGMRTAQLAEQVQALRGLLMVRYVEWFERGNAE